MRNLLYCLFAAFALQSCGEDSVPKPAAYLRLEYPEAQYLFYDDSCPFSFAYNERAQLVQKPNCDMSISYRNMKGTIFLTYRPVTDNLNALLRDAQKLTYEHTVKADDIIEQPYVNPEKKVYGMFYSVGGNAATNVQFYATDSVKNFITGSLYFYTKPRFDSIMPAASYIKNDMQEILETLEWRN